MIGGIRIHWSIKGQHYLSSAALLEEPWRITSTTDEEEEQGGNPQAIGYFVHHESCGKALVVAFS